MGVGVGMKGIIILGSSRSDGHTAQIAKYLQQQGGYDLIDLKDYSFSGFDYNHKNRTDDFLPLMRRLTDQYDLLIFATPVYWYTMSGIMKHFFDRISDCLKIEKPTGRKLRGMHMAMICCSSDDEEYPEMEMPFKRSADYLGMNYHGYVHTWIENELIPSEVQQRLSAFAVMLSQNIKD